MEYQKIINLLDNISNQPSKSRTKNWVEINDDARRTYNKNGQIKLKTSLLKSSVSDHSDVHIRVSGTITIDGAGADYNSKRLNERNKGVIFKYCAPFDDCISEIKNAQIYNGKDLNVLMPMHNLTQYSDSYSKTSGTLWQYFRDDPNDNIVASDSLKFKISITGKTPASGNTKDAKIAVPLNTYVILGELLKCL